MKPLLVLLLCACGLSSCQSTYIYVVRHAERLNPTDDTTPLSQTGHTRATTLAKLLQNVQIDSIYATPFLRTQQTAQPLAELLNKPIISYPAHPTEKIVERLKKLHKHNALVVGHSNTILEIVRGLGCTPTLSSITATEYDNLFVVKKQGKKVSLQERTFGTPTQ